MPNARSALVNFREREIRSIFYVARNFPPRKFLSLCSQLKSQDLSWWFHASSVLRRDTILFARALNREDESLQNNILSNIIRLTLRICRFKKLHASRSIENRGSIGSIWSMEVHGEQFRRQWI